MVSVIGNTQFNSAEKMKEHMVHHNEAKMQLLSNSIFPTHSSIKRKDEDMSEFENNSIHAPIGPARKEVSTWSDNDKQLVLTTLCVSPTR
ncbi:hypothetical protein COLO4_29953 [Corchorus olitorius]|uniref:Uncharacterized protein n=1 Tax=Corchorus olitorius TaxID=93759 RepID=A0A1R3HCC2_9ROSI|nr:hypothetical protein COLO4_29953 [Corchorus olitorius]